MTEAQFEYQMANDPKFYAENHDPIAKWCDCKGEVCICQTFSALPPIPDPYEDILK